MNSEIETIDPSQGLVPVTRDANLQSVVKEELGVPAIGVIQGNNPLIKAGKCEDGNFFDFESETDLGNEIVGVVLDFRYRIMYYDSQKVYKETLYLHTTDTDWTTHPLRMALDEKYKDGKKKTAATDLLIYLPDYSALRHIYLKGMLESGGAQWLDCSSQGGKFSYSRIKTVFVEADNTWYKLVPTPILGRIVQLPTNAAKVKELFNTKPKPKEKSNETATSREER